MSNQIAGQGLSDAEILDQVSHSFDGLAVGESFEIVADRPLSGVLELFQERSWGLFDWHPLEQGPSQYAVVVHRSREKAGMRQIREFFGYDHRRCDDLYAMMENAAQSGDQQGANRFLGKFEVGMFHHFNMEEKGMFPAFEERTGMRQGPTMVMRMEHEQMRGILRQLRQSIDKGDLNAVVRAGMTLLMVMQQHNVKEEQMLYMMADMHIGPDADQILKQVQRLSVG